MSRSPEQRWQRATQYLTQGQLMPARAQLEAIRTTAPNHVFTLLLEARIAWQEGRLRDAADHACAAAHVSSDDPRVSCEMIETLLQTGETAVAHAMLDRLHWTPGSSSDVLLRLADYLQRLGEHAHSLRVLDSQASRLARDASFHCYRGEQLMFLGRLDEAADEFKTCLTISPAFGRAAYRLARLDEKVNEKKFMETINAGLRQATTGTRAHAAFEFAHYHALESRGRYDEAWKALAHANAEMHTIFGDDAERQLAAFGRFVDHFDLHPLQAGAMPLSGACPIFVLGLPRSGTTLLERMLANHSQVKAAGELTEFGKQLALAAGTQSIGSDEFLSRLHQLDFAGLGRQYLKQAEWRADGRRFFVDKQPANAMLAGLIHMALPQAKILHMVRDSMDVCFSNFRAMFGDTYSWSYDLKTLAGHHGNHHRLMRNWQSAFPASILDVSYTNLVQNPEATLRKVLAFCGLEWEAGCDDPAHNAEPVSTLSSVQVREPVHAKGMGLWQKYVSQLDPLRRALLAA
jgi:tetratricopeptide (TPR) repeat protein